MAGPTYLSNLSRPHWKPRSGRLRLAKKIHKLIFALAVALLWHREHERALVEARRCVALEPNSAEGHIAIAHILTYSGHAKAAIDTIDAHMRLDPFYKDIVLYFLAEARISLGQFEQAITALKQRLERN